MVFSKKRGPIYMQIKEEIKDRILSASYPKGENIPTENELEEEFGASKITIRRAVEELVKEGFLHKQSGKGTKVISNKPFSKLSKGQNFTEFLIDEGFEVTKELISVERIQLAATDNLAAYFGNACYRAKRCFKLDGKPYIYFQHYFPSWLDFDSETWSDNDSIYSFMGSKGIDFHYFMDEFEVEVLSKEGCRILELEPKPMLKRIRTSFDEGNRCVEYAEAFYETSLHRYVVKLEI